jgi:hypothetical protein
MIPRHRMHAESRQRKFSPHRFRVLPPDDSFFDGRVPASDHGYYFVTEKVAIAGGAIRYPGSPKFWLALNTQLARVRSPGVD